MVAPEGGGMHGCSGGMCMVAPGGVCGCSGGVCGCFGGACMVALEGVCVVAPGGGVRGCSGGGGGRVWDTTRYGDTVNERAVRILLECIIFLIC